VVLDPENLVKRIDILHYSVPARCDRMAVDRLDGLMAGRALGVT
jgi:hypothetical protein